VKRRPVDWPRVRAALTRLDVLLLAHPELRGRLDVAAAELGAEHERDLAGAPVEPVASSSSTSTVPVEPAPRASRARVDGGDLAPVEPVAALAVLRANRTTNDNGAAEHERDLAGPEHEAALAGGAALAVLRARLPANDPGAF